MKSASRPASVMFIASVGDRRRAAATARTTLLEVGLDVARQGVDLEPVVVVWCLRWPALTRALR